LIFVGHDWAEEHHDVVLLDEAGERLASARLGEGVDGVARFHALVAERVDEADEVVIGTETDRGLFVGALVAAGYQVFAVNPKAVDRYRDRHRLAGGKSDGPTRRCSPIWCALIAICTGGWRPTPSWPRPSRC
jgi:hypothetical protein